MRSHASNLAGYLILVIVLIFTGCATQETPMQRAQRIEPMLSAAGFHMKPASSPEQQTNLQGMTPLKVRFYPLNGKMHYWFADPVYCDCLFSGNEAAYQRYEQIRLQQRDVRAQEQTAELNADAAQEEQMNWMMWPGEPYLMP
jgi:hypothetical protein